MGQTLCASCAAIVRWPRTSWRGGGGSVRATAPAAARCLSADMRRAPTAAAGNPGMDLAQPLQPVLRPSAAPKPSTARAVAAPWHRPKTSGAKAPHRAVPGPGRPAWATPVAATNGKRSRRPRTRCGYRLAIAKKVLIPSGAATQSTARASSGDIDLAMRTASPVILAWAGSTPPTRGRPVAPGWTGMDVRLRGAGGRGRSATLQFRDRQW